MVLIELVDLLCAVMFSTGTIMQGDITAALHLLESKANSLLMKIEPLLKRAGVECGWLQRKAIMTRKPGQVQICVLQMPSCTHVRYFYTGLPGFYLVICNKVAPDVIQNANKHIPKPLLSVADEKLIQGHYDIVSYKQLYGMAFAVPKDCPNELIPAAVPLWTQKHLLWSTENEVKYSVMTTGRQHQYELSRLKERHATTIGLNKSPREKMETAPLSKTDEAANNKYCTATSNREPMGTPPLSGFINKTRSHLVHRGSRLFVEC